jgi:hypothetical protein
MSSTRPEIVINRAKGQNRLGRFSFPAVPYPHTLLLNFKKYDYKNIDERYNQQVAENIGSVNAEGRFEAATALREQTTIELPFPNQILDSLAINVAGMERDVIVDTIASGLGNLVNSDASLASVPGQIGDAAKKIAGIMDQMGRSFVQMTSDENGGLPGGLMAGITSALEELKISSAAQAATYLVSSLSPAIGQSVNNITGTAMNPRETLTFRGVNLRSFTFNWDMYPSNEADSEQIRQIIATLKRNALPTTETLGSENGVGISRLFFNYPAVVELSLLGIDPSFFPRFKPCMISQVDVNYGGNSAALPIIKGGKPGVVSITISFTELNTEAAEDYASAGAGTPAVAETETADDVAARLDEAQAGSGLGGA